MYFATKSLIDSQRIMADAPIVLLQAPMFFGHVEGPINNPATLPQFWHNDGLGHPLVTTALARAWASLIDTIDPALVVCDHAPFALLALRARPDIQRVVFGVGLLCPPDAHPMQAFGGDAPSPPGQDAVADESRVLHGCNEVLGRIGGDPMDHLGQLSTQCDDILITSYAEIDPFGPRTDDLYCGVWSVDGGRRIKWLTDKPHVVAYLRESTRLHALLEGLASTNAESLVYIAQPTESTKALIAKLGLRLAPELLDFRALHRTDLVVTHGTHAATVLPLLQGIPVVMQPINRETSMIAASVSRLGAGVTLQPDVDRAVQTGVSRLIADKTYTGAARRFAARYDHLSETQRISAACDRLEALL